MPRVSTLALAVLLPCLTVFANDRATDLVRVQTDRDWDVNQHVCFERENSILACGTVVATDSYLISVRAPKLADRVHRGDQLTVAPYGMGRNPATESVALVVTRTPSQHLHSIAGGTLVTQAAILPSAHFQAAVADGILVGVLGTFGERKDTLSSLKLFGTLMTLELYPGGESWSGFFFRLAGGAYSIRASVGSNVESEWSPTASGALGIRFLTGAGLHFGLFGGGQYTERPKLALVEENFTGLRWTGNAEIGLAF